MQFRTLLALPVLITGSAFAAHLPAIPDKPIANKKELLFSDDFQAAEPAKQWHKVVPTFAFENGTLKGTQTRDQNIPAADGKPGTGEGAIRRLPAGRAPLPVIEPTAAEQAAHEAMLARLRKASGKPVEWA